MRHPIFLTLCLTGAFGLAACQDAGNDSVDRAMQAVNVVDESNLGDIMLTVADPNEAVVYFTRTSAEQPDRVDLQRGLAQSLVRAQRPVEAAAAWRTVTKHPESTHEDKVELADALIRASDWEGAKTALNSVPPTYETFKRYRLEAMVADANKDWKRADSFYEIAMGLTTRPAGVMNNWGFSKLTRGAYPEAERLFTDAIRQDNAMFTAKNNLVLARAAQRNYTLPVMPMTQLERAQLLHTLGLSAVKQGDVETAKGLLRDAVQTHPQHFDEAVRSLAALENNVRG
ncbi:MAG: tetratricopeptide repeat protein [Paracoccaceae bacterium]|uniref:tetratricopeptide repeat protein n=1 Tax=Seohaeicola saemankumensis TaxID=481181 RepID=UPI001E5F32C0|nr:tetratricopeptide repeat protein [Seohaeicola saemankumensis]MCD1625447.1 tetratricopeptide repeat protein [Seohaeicola saemankumensis]